MIDKPISHFRILEESGQGGRGEVYKAEDIKLERIIALEFLLPIFSSDEEAKKCSFTKHNQLQRRIIITSDIYLA